MTALTTSSLSSAQTLVKNNNNARLYINNTQQLKGEKHPKERGNFILLKT